MYDTKTRKREQQFFFSIVSAGRTDSDMIVNDHASRTKQNKITEQITIIPTHTNGKASTYYIRQYIPWRAVDPANTITWLKRADGDRKYIVTRITRRKKNLELNYYRIVCLVHFYFNNNTHKSTTSSRSIINRLLCLSHSWLWEQITVYVCMYIGMYCLC